MPDAVIHHSVHGTHWLDATALRAAIEERHPDLSVPVAHTPAELLEFLADAEVVLTSFLDTAVLENVSVRWIQAPSAGVDMLDLDALRDREVLLTTAAGAHAQPVAEQVLGYMLAFERRLDEAIAMRGRGVWERFTGGELAEKTLGVVGLGAIGRRTAELAAAVGMDVVGTRSDPSETVEAVDTVYGPEDLSAVLLESDYVLVACPLTEETEGLIGREQLGLMGDDAVLVNVARGPVVDETALVTELQQRGIRGAALDVFATEPLPAESTLWDLSNVILTPHNAGVSPRLPDRIADIFLANYEAFLDGEFGQLQNRVL